MNLLKVSKSKNLLVTALILVSAAFGTSCGEGQSQLSVPGVNGPNLELQQDNLLISMTFENIQLDGGLRYAIPKYDLLKVFLEEETYQVFLQVVYQQLPSQFQNGRTWPST
jgi:hypothetical protein